MDPMGNNSGVRVDRAIVNDSPNKVHDPYAILLRLVFNTPDGRRLLDAMIERHVKSPRFFAGESSHDLMVMQAVRSDFILEIEQLINDKGDGK